MKQAKKRLKGINLLFYFNNKRDEMMRHFNNKKNIFVLKIYEKKKRNL
jgi:hypothetical protein